jgi:hypothetical protein
MGDSFSTRKSVLCYCTCAKSLQDTHFYILSLPYLWAVSGTMDVDDIMKETFAGILLDAKLERSIVIQGFMKAFHEIEKSGNGFGKVFSVSFRLRATVDQLACLCMCSPSACPV